MRTSCRSVLALCSFVLGLGVGGHVLAASGVGPYYAVPAWDQTLPAATRFIVLTNMNSEAVLDRNTGLVWEKTPTSITAFPWQVAQVHCIDKVVGGQKGWRLPSIPELSSLVDPGNSNPALPAGHPFLNVSLVNGYWSATTNAGNPDFRWGVNFTDGAVLSVHSGDDTMTHAWCVRGGMNADRY